MNHTSARLRAFFTVLLGISLTVAAFGDTIRLKDGSIIKGRITDFTNGRFTVTIGEGPRRRQMTFTAGEIESIKFDGAGAEPSDVQADTRTASNIRVSQPSEPAPTKPVQSSQPPARTSTTPPSSSRPASNAKPVELNVKVMADNTSNGWTNSGWVVRKGQRIHVSGSGTVSIGNGKTVSPSGTYSIEDEQKLLKNVPTGALLAVIGDDNNDFIYIGSDREFTAERDGTLFLGLNEGNLNDNSGSFDVKIEILPGSGE